MSVQPFLFFLRIPKDTDWFHETITAFTDTHPVIYASASNNRDYVYSFTSEDDRDMYRNFREESFDLFDSLIERIKIAQIKKIQYTWRSYYYAPGNKGFEIAKSEF